MVEEVNNGYNLNISRYGSTSEDEVQINLTEVNARLSQLIETIKSSTDTHNAFLTELGLNPI